MQLPIKVLKDKDQNPFIPFVTTSSVVENGTNRTLDDILHNLTVPVTNLNSLENNAVADMMTNMKDYKDSGFAIIYVNTDNTGLLLAFEKITTVDVLNKCWSFVSSFNADSKAYRINITGYYNADSGMFTVSSAAIEEIQAGIDLSDYYTKEESDEILNTRIPIFNLPVTDTGVNFTSGAPIENASAIINFLYSLGDYTGRVIVHNNYSKTAARFHDVLMHVGGANKQSTSYAFRGMYNNGSDYTIAIHGITVNVYGTWTNNVFTANRVIVLNPYDAVKPVNVRDYISDTLTDPVQGKVIKKYVDDNINNTVNNAINALPMMPVYYISAANVISAEVNITDAETLAQVNEIINSNYGKDVLLCIKDETYRDYYMFLVMFWNKPKTNYTNVYTVFSTIFLIQTDGPEKALTVLPMNFTYNSVAGESITVTRIKYDTLNGNKKNERILLEKFYTRISGYDASKTQVLKNVNGTLKWITEEVA